MTSTTGLSAAMLQAVERLENARFSRVPCPPIHELIDGDADLAYAVQRAATQRRIAAGASVVGRKVGLTSPAVQAQLGVDEPDFGVLFDDMRRDHGAAVPVDSLLQPRIEAEIAFVLGGDLAEGPLDLAQVQAATSYVVPALEIVDSRIADWNITLADTVADNASGGLFVLGPSRRALGQVDPVAVRMRMFRDGEEVSTGSGIDCLGDPMAALAWLARTVRDRGVPLLAGEVVLSGALGPMIPVVAGDSFTAEITDMGTVAVSFTRPQGAHG